MEERGKEAETGNNSTVPNSLPLLPQRQQINQAKRSYDIGKTINEADRQQSVWVRPDVELRSEDGDTVATESLGPFPKSSYDPSTTEIRDLAQINTSAIYRRP
jgi:hypothetical protein